MSATTFASYRRSSAAVTTVAAVLGVVAATGWFIGARQVVQSVARARQATAADRGAELVGLLRKLAQERAKTVAQVLAETRFKATLGEAELDRVTLLDMLEDLKKLDDQALLAVLTPTGKVAAVVGAPELDGVDLSSSAAVKAALAQPGEAAAGAWIVDQRVEEIAISAVRTGNRPVGLLVVGVRVADGALSKVASAVGVHLALFVGDRPTWSDATLPPAAWSSPLARVVEVTDTPPARYVVLPSEASTPEPLVAFAWAVPIGALFFASLAFWRRGGP